MYTKSSKEIEDTNGRHHYHFTRKQETPVNTPFTRCRLELENGIKSVVLASHLHDAGRSAKFCLQNIVSVSKTAKFVILPFSNSAGIA